jgi:tetraacyldisaccharide-1-P 4'-kinase
MTSKDAVKCSSFANKYVWALNVSLELPKALVDDVLNTIAKHYLLDTIAKASESAPIKII